MKKYNRLPDFHKLCEPEQNHKMFFLSQQIFFFFTAAILGFLWEVLIFLVKERQFRNRGFLYGPWLPVYGVGAVLFYVLLAGNSCRAKNAGETARRSHKNPVMVFLLSLLIGTGVELATGIFLDVIWNRRYWDYTGCLFHFHGYVCLWSALGFGVAGTLWVCLVSDFLTRLWIRIPVRFRLGLNTILILLFLTDCAAALIFPNAGRGITFP